MILSHSQSPSGHSRQNKSCLSAEVEVWPVGKEEEAEAEAEEEEEEEEEEEGSAIVNVLLTRGRKKCIAYQPLCSSSAVMLQAQK